MSSTLALGDFALAQSLSGQVGDKKGSIFFPPGMTGPCPKVYRDYVAAAGHSAYVATPSGGGKFALICGASLNAPSQKAAEDRAILNCKAGTAKYKVKVIKRCDVIASK